METFEQNAFKVSYISIEDLTTRTCAVRGEGGGGDVLLLGGEGKGCFNTLPAVVGNISFHRDVNEATMVIQKTLFIYKNYNCQAVHVLTAFSQINISL